jgi:hypothetical protein
MHQAGWAVEAEGGQQAADLPEREVKPGGGFLGTQLASIDLVDDEQALLLSNGQGFSLNRWG